MKLLNAKQYPKTIDINDETYQIRMVSRIPGCIKSDYGMCDYDKKIIWVRKNQSTRGLLRTFIHEVLHAIETEYDIKLYHKRIDVLEIAIASIIVDNF